MNPWLAGLLKLLLWGSLGYLLLCLVAFLAQRRMLYFPDLNSEQTSLQQATRLGLAPWRDGAGRLLGWRRKQVSEARPRILLLHGNAGDALGRVDYMAVLEAAGFEAVLLEYPGYGCRSGQPSEPTLVADAKGALGLLRKEGLPVFLLGESLGSGVAIQVAAEEAQAVSGLLLVVPFARMTEVAGWHYPIFPMGVILRDRWDSLRAIRSYPGPVAMLLAGRDEVVGVHQGRRLAAACPGPLKVWEVPQASHNGVPLQQGRPPWSEALSFLRQSSGMGQ